jgi:hypothetical protein
LTGAVVSSELASATTATGSSTEVDSSAATGATSTTCSVVSALVFLKEKKKSISINHQL